MAFTVTDWAKTYLASGSTALAKALRIERRDGQVFAFTDIRRFSTLPAFTVRGVTVPACTYSPRGRLIVTNIEQSDRPSETDNWEVTLVMGDHLPQDDVAAGLFFGATYTLVFFDWRTNTPIMLRIRGKIGERTLGGLKVVFKMRSLAQGLQGDILDVTSGISRGDWGDPELDFFDLDGNTSDGFAARVTSAINSVDSSYPRRRFVLTDAAGFPTGRFSGGVASFLSGANDGALANILAYEPADGTFTLETALRFDLAEGDAVRAQIRPPITLDEWLTFFGSGMYCPCEPGIPTNDSANSITRA